MYFCIRKGEIYLFSMRIVLIGAGNLATHLGKALCDAHHEVLQVYSRTISHAQTLADTLHAQYTDSSAQLLKDAECYVFAVKDQVLPSIIKEVWGMHVNPSALFVHTAGSIPLNVFPEEINSYGVLYPMQTFSKQREVDFTHIPVFVEGNNDETLKRLEVLAKSISQSVYRLSSADRRYLHLSAVWACNFANHCYDIASRMLDHIGVPFDVMLPLIDETARKVHELSPKDAQTGPAVRYDEHVMNAQLELMKGQPMLQDIYRQLSQSIHERAEE